MYAASDFTAAGFGLPWGQTRRFSNRLTVSRDAGNGYNWFVDQWQYLERATVSGLVSSIRCEVTDRSLGGRNEIEREAPNGS